MSINRGKKNVSGHQRDLLRRAKSSDDPSDAAIGLYRMAGDEDIEDGEEDLHPDWLDIYHTHKDALSTHLPSSIRDLVDEFYQTIQG
jgi:hypothetical protein